MTSLKKKVALLFGSLLGLLLVASFWFFKLPSIPETELPTSTEAIKRGEYMVYAGGCISCHQGTDGTPGLSGGLALESDFGTFYVPNITPDSETGIGGWSGRDFLLALKHGRDADWEFFFPAFPYRSYAGMTDADVLDVGAYLMAQEAVVKEVPDHELVPWLTSWMMPGWNLLADFLQPGLTMPADPVQARGAYLVRHLGHCGECHTPRNELGITDLNNELAGAVVGDKTIEAINQAALADWSEEDIVLLLLLGVKPDGEYVGGEMADVIDHNTSRLTQADQQAIAAFLKR